jgi:hypothetical protein
MSSEVYNLLSRKIDEYERVFGEMTFSNIDMTMEETIETIDRALASGEPVYDDVPEGAII